VIRGALSSLARNESLGGLLNRTPIARTVVKRVVGGDSVGDAIAVSAELADIGRWISLERSAPPATDDDQAQAILADYVMLVDQIGAAGLAGVAEVSVFPESLAADGSFDRLTTLCRHATGAGVAVMVGMGPAEHVQATLDAVADLQDDALHVGATIQASLLRSEADCERFADRRVRLVKGGRREPAGVAHDQPIETDKAFVRCAKSLLAGGGAPSFATHDARLLDILEALTARMGRPKQTYEYAFYLGRLDGAQDRLAAAGERVRVYVPYGPDWFERLVGGLAEQPTSIAGAVRSLLPGATS